MINKILKICFSLVIGLSLFLLSGCYKKEKYSFNEGTYSYIGDEFILYEDIIVEKIFINLSLATESETEQADSSNLIMNRKDKKIYKVAFLLKVKDQEELIKCDFESLPKVGDQIDHYYIYLDISKLTRTNVHLRLRLNFTADFDYDTGLDPSTANKIRIDIKTIKIDSKEYDESSSLFPNFFKDYKVITFYFNPSL